MKRLCFLAPDVGNARRAVASFLSAGIPEEQIYALARFGTDMEFLPDAGPAANDFLPAYTRGAGIGGTTGVLVGLSAMAFPPSGIIVGGGLAVLLGFGLQGERCQGVSLTGMCFFPPVVDTIAVATQSLLGFVGFTNGLISQHHRLRM